MSFSAITSEPTPAVQNAVPNGKSGVILGNDASGNIIGGLSTPARNVISGNIEYGIFLGDTKSNSIFGNYIGLNAGGIAPLGNALSGIDLTSGAQNNLIGHVGAGAGQPHFRQCGIRRHPGWCKQQYNCGQLHRS